MVRKFVNDFEWTPEQLERYSEDGFVVVDEVVTSQFADILKERYSTLFAGNFETGTNPDNFPVKVEEGDHSPVTRWMTSPWRCDYTIANYALHPVIGKLIARLNGWSGMRFVAEQRALENSGVAATVDASGHELSPLVCPG